MYKLLLILKYLRRKLAPLFAASAVMLCTAMVIIVISVMGGFLDTLRTSIQRITGDVIVTSGSLTGFPYYEELIAEAEKLPQIKAGTPVINSWGLIKIDGRTIAVQLEGIRPRQMNAVVPYKESLYWTSEDAVEFLKKDYPINEDSPQWERKWFEQQLENWQNIDLKQLGMTFEPPAMFQREDERKLRGIVPGIEVPNRHHFRPGQDRYRFRNSSIREVATVTAVPLTSKGTLGAIEPKYRQFIVVNELKSGHHDIDDMRVFMPFDDLQELLEMHPREQQTYDETTLEPTGEVVQVPGRATQIIFRAAEGVSADEARDAVNELVNSFMVERPDMSFVYTVTWEEMFTTILTAVGNEKRLVTFLFVIISVVAIVMVATTFYMTVLEKTRDIGTLRAIGASRFGILLMFLGYGLAIGIVGSGLGYGIAWLIVTNINEIQEAIAVWTGWQMWDPSIYAFDRIPARVDPLETGGIVLGAIVSSVVGSLIPAVIAARLNPIDALRYE